MMHAFRSDTSGSSVPESIHDSFLQLRQSTQQPLAQAVRLRATRPKRFSVEQVAQRSPARLPDLSPSPTRFHAAAAEEEGERPESVDLPPVRPQPRHLTPAPALTPWSVPQPPSAEDRAELASRLSNLTFVSGLSGLSDGADATAMAQDALAPNPRPWREAPPPPPKRSDWGPKQLRDLCTQLEVELLNMKSALDMSLQMEDTWRRRAEQQATAEPRSAGEDTQRAQERMGALLTELEKFRDQLSTLLPHPFSGQMLGCPLPRPLPTNLRRRLDLRLLVKPTLGLLYAACCKEQETPRLPCGQRLF